MSTGKVKVDWDYLFNLQKQLDDYVFQKYPGVTYDSLELERKLALVVELSELVNETKVFKFWSVKGMDKARALDEYADVLHFILSHLIGSNLDPRSVEYPEPLSLVESNNKEYKQKASAQGFELLGKVFSCLDSPEFLNWIEDFFSFGSTLGFSYKEVFDAYCHKNQINIQRQNSGY